MRVAIKPKDTIFYNAKQMKTLLRELVILRLLNGHSAITALIDVLPQRDCENFDCLYLVFEFVDADLQRIVDSRQHLRYVHHNVKLKTLKTHVQKLNTHNCDFWLFHTFYSPFAIKYIMYQVLVGLTYMHSGGIVHGDLKPGNILINADGTIKVRFLDVCPIATGTWCR